MAQLTKIEGIGASYAEKLKAVGINTTEALLEKGSTPAARNKLVEDSGISKKLILRWINMADLFRIKGVGVIAGCMVTEGTVHRSDSARLRRNGEKVWQGKIGTLKRFKDDAREVAGGFECGIGLEGRDDIIEGDVIEAFAVEERARKLE